MEEGRRMFQIFAARMFEQRVLSAYREKVARERQQRLIQELEEEDRLRQEREQKKAQDRERKKEQKRQQKLLREAERAAKEAQRKAEEAAAKAELERKQELERQKREQERIRKEEERQKKEEERRRRIKEEKDRAAEKERRRKEKEEAERQERQKREAQERRERQQKEEEERRQREFKELKERRETELKEEMARREMEANERKRQWEKEAQEKPRSSGATEKVSRGGRSSRQTTASASNPVTDTVVPPTTRTSTAAAAATSVTVTSSSSSSSISTSSPISSSSSPLPPTGGSIVNASSIPLSSPSQSTTLASFNSTVTSHPFDQESRQKMLMDALVGSSRPTASPSLFQEPSLMDPPDIPSLRTHRPSQPLLSPNHPRSSLDLLQAMPPPPLLNGPLDLAMSVHDTPSSPTGGVALAPPSLGIGMLPMYNRASNPVENSGLSRSIGRPANHLAPIGQPVNGRRASTAAGPIGSPVVSRSGKSSIDKGSTEATPIKRPTGSVEHESTNSFFSNFLFGEPNRGSYMIPLMHHESEARTGHNVDLQPPPFNRRFSSDPVGMNWTNGWTATSMLSDNVHGKLFGDVLVSYFNLAWRNGPSR
ncbi:uncharacterized protein BYT42DRAFT_285279 [Radiomyces spectabilis]|uniref:uncharacterized protein n=1 Tax=Radiomyces spectabilis TaxID=64574 RepID=UPI00221F2563|nr:uncharacterized protein BYT42DRAFT_285279 [Radiomyces spectabilis]KAI8380895.1 hypothetical protein BYT42DRAFT_285279 [Radiomyces spectabilis]